MNKFTNKSFSYLLHIQIMNYTTFDYICCINHYSIIKHNTLKSSSCMQTLFYVMTAYKPIKLQLFSGSSRCSWPQTVDGSALMTLPWLNVTMKSLSTGKKRFQVQWAGEGRLWTETAWKKCFSKMAAKQQYHCLHGIQYLKYEWPFPIKMLTTRSLADFCHLWSLGQKRMRHLCNTAGLYDEQKLQK